MTLQEFTKSKVKEFGGLDYFLIQLDYIKPLVPNHLKFHIEEIKIYYGLMHIVDFDMEKDFIIYRDRVIGAMSMFEDIYEQHGDLFARLMYIILSEGLRRTGKIRMIS